MFVARLQQAILSSENISAQKNIVVETDKKLIDNCGVERQFDIFWEYQLGGFTYKTIIECKDYDSKVSVDKIDALIGKVKDLPDLRAVFSTKKGYQSGARAKAEHNKIDLLIVRRAERLRLDCPRRKCPGKEALHRGHHVQPPLVSLSSIQSLTESGSEVTRI